MLKIVTSTSSQEFPQSCMFSYIAMYLFYSSCFPELPCYACFTVLIIILQKYCFKNFISYINGFLSISYIQFIDIKGTAWGHGQVIENHLLIK